MEGAYSGGKNTRQASNTWSTLTELEVESLTKEFYLQFYFRPRIVWNRISQIKSLEELKRYIKVGWQMLLQKSEIYSHLLTDTSEAEKLLAESNNYLSEARLLRVAVVIPTYNEKDNIEKITSAISEVLPQADVVIVDDNSPDGTGIIADRLSSQNSCVHVLHRRGARGLGLAYIDGFKFVLNNLEADYIFEMDADFSHNPQYLPIFLHYIQNYELVLGSRFLRRVSIKNMSLWRNIISKTTKWFVNILMGIKLTDVTGGFKCFRRRLLEKIDLDKIESKGHAFQIEISYAVRKIGANIRELPLLFAERTAGSSKMSTRIMLEGIWLVLKLSLQRIRQMTKLL